MVLTCCVNILWSGRVIHKLRQGSNHIFARFKKIYHRQAVAVKRKPIMHLHLSGKTVVLSLFKIHAAPRHHLGNAALGRTRAVPNRRVGNPGYALSLVLTFLNLADFPSNLLCRPPNSDVGFARTAVKFAIVIRSAVIINRIPRHGKRL